MITLPRRSPDLVLLGATLVGLAGGAVAQAAGFDRVGIDLWIGVQALGVALAAWWVMRAVRAHRLGVDMIALAALIGTLAVGEHLAGALIGVMLTTGRTLEAWAAGRAERELRALLDLAPKVAYRYGAAGLEHPLVEELAVGDRLLIRSGEVVPVDGTVIGHAAVLDESTLTGEPLPVTKSAGQAVPAGAVNAGAPFDLVATTNAAESTFAGIVRLVRRASASTSPFVRTADRFAVLFLVTTALVAGGAWIVSGDLARAVAVLVVATPCPLILAAPIAIVAGISRAARRGVVVKGGAVLEALARAETLLIDKTGTLTGGRAEVDEILTADGVDLGSVLRLAASLEQASPHVLAMAVVRAASVRQLVLSFPTDTVEVPGTGIGGRVDGRAVLVGSADWVGADPRLEWVARSQRRAEVIGASCVWVAVDGVPAAALILSDRIRPDAARTIRRLRRCGIRRVVMVTGDSSIVARAIGELAGVDAIEAEQSPAGKVAVVRRETTSGGTIMVGDGVNDAPALAEATVGVALGARGSTASSETADVVLTVDRLERIGDARLIARRSRSIAVESVLLGMVLSLGAMGLAAAGLLPATWGALLQEVIDVAAIANALRALGAGRDEIHLGIDDTTVAQRFAAAHLDLRPSIEVLCAAARALGTGDDDAMALVRSACRLLEEDIEPHEREEDRYLYPIVARALGGSERTATMSRAHAEISRLSAQLRRLVGDLESRPASPADTGDMQRLLYGLYALLDLHFAQEDENYLSLADPADGDRSADESRRSAQAR